MQRPALGRDRSARRRLRVRLERTAGRPIAHLSGFADVLHVDGYAAYESLAKGGAARLAFCCSHVQRQFFDLTAASQIATEMLSRIAVLYQIEAEIRGRLAEERRAARQERSRPVVEALERFQFELSRLGGVHAALGS